MNSLSRMTAIALLSFAASGCVFIDGKYVDHNDWRDDQSDNRAMISKLEIGTSRNSVVDSLGTPADSEAFTHDGEELRVLFYRTQRKHSDGETTRDETTPLVFKNNQLIGWGDSVYRDYRS
ncbi:DUF3192 domain-containing protein [Congregibacter sp.]|uniref:DUF3192 domain-containing protein n=1 Tax=Congregibacter sp. TaxID=2744308 RepID=UPI003F6A841E